MEDLSRLDLQVFRLIHQTWHQSWLDPLFWVISSTGLGWVQSLLAISVALAFSNGSDFKARFTDPQFFVWPILFMVIAYSGTVPQIFKQLADRERPSNLPWAVPQETFFHHSFPSGHTTSSFAIAFYLFFVWRGTPRAIWGWVALLWASLVGFSRIYRGVHWPSDVLGGIAVGLMGAGIALLIWPPKKS